MSPNENLNEQPNVKSDNSMIFGVRQTEPVKEAPASPSRPQSTEKQVIIPEYTERPPSIMKEPYLVEMLKLGEAKEHFEMPSLIKEINEFVLSEFERNKLEDTNESYKEIIEKYLNKLPENLDKYALIERIVDLIRIDKKLIEAMNEKERIMTADITELSSSQLKKRIENGKISRYKGI